MVLLVGTQSVISITHDPLTLTKYNLDGSYDSVSLRLPPIISSNAASSRPSGGGGESSDDDENGDNNTGKNLASSAKSDEVAAVDNRRVVSGGLAPSEKILVICDDLKQLIVYEVNSWKVLGAQKVDRKCDHIIFNEKEDKFIVSNRSGWIYGYEVNAFIDHTEIQNKETFLLGHNAIILDVKLSPGSKFLATCDRDEKIRISNFPNSYNIESYCLGHTQFVSCLAFIDDRILVSGSGDGTLRVWEYIKGKELCCHNFKDDLELKDEKIAPMEIHITTVDVIGTVVIVTFYNSPTFITYTFDKTTKNLVNLIKTKVEANILGSALNNCGGFLCFIEKPFSISCFELSMYEGEVCLFEVSHQLTNALLKNVKLVEEYITERKQLTNIGWLWKNSYNNHNEYLEKKKERQEIHAMKKLKST